MIEGKQYFMDHPYLCDIVTTICLTACVVSLFSIGGTSFNRYIIICNVKRFEWLLSRQCVIITCFIFWLIGFILSLPALVGWTENVYDHKLLECFWNRLHSLSFTIFFSAGIVFTPIFIISFSFVKIYLHVRASRKRLLKDLCIAKNRATTKHIRLSVALFTIFSMFVLCWAPYSLLIVIDIHDTLPHEVYLFTLLLAHLHSSLNWLIYAITHAHFRQGYRIILNCITFGLIRKNNDQFDDNLSLNQSEIHPAMRPYGSNGPITRSTPHLENNDLKDAGHPSIQNDVGYSV